MTYNFLPEQPAPSSRNGEHAFAWRIALDKIASLASFVRSYGTPAGRRALGNLIGLVLLQIVSQGCSFGNLLLLTSSLTPDHYGSLVFAMSIPTVLQAIASGGFAAILVRDLSRSPANADSTITAYLALTSAIGVVCGIGLCGWAFAATISAEERMLLAWLALGNVFASINIAPVYDAVHRQTIAAALLIPADLIGLGITAWLATTSTLTLPILGGVIAGRMGLQCAVLFAFLPQFGERFRWRFHTRRAMAMLRAGWPIALATLLYLIPNGVSIVIVRFEHGPTQAAIYGLASQFAGYLFLVFSLAVRILQPHIAGPHGMQRSMMVKIAAFALGFLIVMGAVAVAAGYVLFERILDPVYASGFGLFLPLLAGTIFVCGTCVLAHYLIVFRRERTIAISYSTSVVVFGLTLWILGPGTLDRIIFAHVAFAAVLFCFTAVATTLAWRAHHNDFEHAT